MVSLPCAALVWEAITEVQKVAKKAPMRESTTAHTTPRFSCAKSSKDGAQESGSNNDSPSFLVAVTPHQDVSQDPMKPSSSALEVANNAAKMTQTTSDWTAQEEPSCCSMAIGLNEVVKAEQSEHTRVDYPLPLQAGLVEYAASQAAAKEMENQQSAQGNATDNECDKICQIFVGPVETPDSTTAFSTDDELAAGHPDTLSANMVSNTSDRVASEDVEDPYAATASSPETAVAAEDSEDDAWIGLELSEEDAKLIDDDAEIVCEELWEAGMDSNMIVSALAEQVR
jgi:hypothetical protein